ncbi:MAG: polysaccharide biosynthesis/export family protein [Muribaculaceae bacterium]|nr:polysaccharide biosynthesis/export family protein [Muribaculaceae bacterium]MDE7111211.1 polysaccharide biosynthesis/export family protein [Muribaculaceae bacterium]
MKLRHVAIGFASLVIVLTGCSSGKTRLPYFTDIDVEKLEIPVGDFSVKIVPDDELLINVSAADPEAVEAYTVPYQHPRQRDFNFPSGQTRESFVLTTRKSNLSLQPYVVSPEGFINFPVLGKIHVAGMTLDGLADYLTEKISEKVVDPMVSVELTNFHVNVIGEVNHPGMFIVNRERFSVLDAIAEAGDLTAYGERNNVMIIREENGKRVAHRINLNKAQALESPYFFLRQNDVVYVEPNTVRQANAKVDNDRQYRLSMTSVIVSAVSVIASLAISLLR